MSYHLWKYFTNGECPVCGGARKDCRRSLRTNLVHCRHRGVISADYYYLRDDAQGFGMYQAIADRVSYSEEQRKLSEFEREQRRLEYLEEEKQREAELAAKYKDSLSIEERDRQIRKILEQLWLWPSHEQKLRSRFEILGLEQKEIDRLIKSANYKSVYQWQKLDIPVSDLFPGVRLGGKSLLIQGDGILIPIKNEEGLYIGLQLRLDRPTEGKKYVWLAGERKRNNKPSSHLQNGDLPLSLHLPPENNRVSNMIGLAEGIGFKGAIASIRLNIPFIGASGGNFTRSAKLLRHYLDFLGCNKSTQIVLFADAGALENKSTLKIYRNTIALIESWGYKVKIGWWNQVEKSVGDIDEIDQDKLKEIEYLSWNEFIAKGNQEIQAALNLINRIDRTATELKRIKKCANLKQQRAEKSEREKILEELTPDEYSRKQYREYRKLKDFDGKIDVKVHKIRLPDLITHWNMRGILVPKSEKGTGKTYRFNELKDKALELGMKIVSFVPRRCLAREQAAKMKMNYIDSEGFFKSEIHTEERRVEQRQINILGEEEITYTIEKHTVKRLVRVENVIEADTIVLCYDSIHKLRGWDFSNTLIFLDELETGIKHLTTSRTLIDKRGEVMSHFQQFIREALSNGGAVVATDADASNIAVNYLHSLAPFAKITKVLNTHPTPAPWEIDLYRGRKHKKKVINEIIEAIERNEKIAIAMDSQSDARAIFAELKEKFPHLADFFKVLDSEAAETKEAKEFIQDINGNLLRSQLVCLMYTPTIYIGVSIEEKVFDRVFGLFVGVLTPSEIRQSLARYRSPVPRTVWVEKVGKFQDSCKETNVEEISRNLFKYNKESIDAIARAEISKRLGREPDDFEMLQQISAMMDLESKRFKNPHINAYAEFLARENYEKYHLGLLLKLELIDEGHNVIDRSDEDKVESEHLKNIEQHKKDFKIEYFIEMAEDPEIDVGEARAILNRADSTKEDRRMAMRAMTADKLPGIELTPDLLAKVHDYHWYAAVKRFWLYHNLTATSEYDRARWDNVAYQIKPYWDKANDFVVSSFPYLPDIKTWLPQIELIHELKLFELVNVKDFEKQYRAEDPPIREFMKRAIKLSDRIKYCFNLKVNQNSSPIKFINALLEKFSVELKAIKYEEKGQTLRYYALDRGVVNECHRRDVLTGLTRKYAAWKTEKEWRVNETQIADSPYLRMRNSEVSSEIIRTKQRSPQIHRANQADETLDKSSDFNLAQTPENIYKKPDVPGNNKNSLTDSEVETHHCASQTNSGDTDKSKSAQQNPQSLVSSGLNNLAHQPENIYIKPDVPGNDPDSLTDSKEGAHHCASQTNSGDTDKSKSAQQNPQGTVSSGLETLADGAARIYIKPDVPGNNQDSLTDSEVETHHCASQTNSGDTDKSKSAQQNPQGTVSSGLETLADGAACIYIKPDVPGINKNSLTNSEERANHSAQQTPSVDSSEKPPHKDFPNNIEAEKEMGQVEVENIDRNSDVPGNNLVSLLLDYLKNLEAEIPKFKIWEQVCQIFQEIAIISPQVESKLLLLCPDYYDRCAKAMGRLSEILPSEEELKNAEQERSPFKENSIAISIPVDEPIQVGDRIFEYLSEKYGIVESIGELAKVRFDLEETSTYIDDLMLEKVRRISVLKKDLKETVELLKKILATKMILEPIKSVSIELFAAAKQYLLATEGKRFIEPLKQIFRQKDYGLYMELW